MKTVFLLLIATCAFAAIEGSVQNATTGKPQPGAVVTLVELGAGMNNLGSVRSNDQGVFTFNATLKPETPYLLQALYEGVTYNQMLRPGSASNGLGIEVYDAAAAVPEARVAQHMILLEPAGSELTVNETVIYHNTAKTTLSDPKGNLKVWIPSAVNTPVRLRITAPQGMPISREAEKSRQPNVYVVRYPIKPGETRIDLQYSMPSTSPIQYTGKILHGGGPVRLVAPQGVKFVSDSLQSLGPEPRTQATVYELKGDDFTIGVEGTGTLRDGVQSSENGAAAAESDNTPGIDMVKPRLYQRIAWIVGLALAMLVLGMAMLYRAA